MPLLRRSHLDLEHFAGLITDSVGVVSVRVRAGAESVVIEYDGTSAAKIEARRVGSETTTARIAAFIHESLVAKSETERLAEEFANRRVLVTLGVAAATFLLTGDLTRLISVFLIDYACAVKLNAPVVIRATMSEGANQGILIKGGQSIEKLSRIDTFVFDKTGTLTRGDLAVTDVIPLAPQLWSEARLMGLAASIEEHSRHPVADAIVRAARQRGVPHVSHGDVDVIIAHGLRTKVAFPLRSIRPRRRNLRRPLISPRSPNR
jgi:manganese/zinc-transporting P-type ATPase C